MSAENSKDVLGKLGELWVIALDDPFRKIYGPGNAACNGDTELWVVPREMV